MIRVRRWVAAAVLGGAVLPITACNPGSESATAAGRPATPASPAAPLEIGGPLYSSVPAVKMAESAGMTTDPIVVPNAVVQNNVRVQIASPVDAKIELIAVQVGKDEQVPPDLLLYHPRDEKREKGQWRRLRENDLVRKGQYICRLDDQLSEVQMQSTKEIIAELGKAIEAAQDAEDAQQKVAELYKKLTGVSDSEKLNNIALVARYKENRIQTQKERVKTLGELLQAQTQYTRCWVECPINGRIVKLLKNQGDFARTGDPILEVQATDQVRIEGKLDIGYSDVVRPGMRVLVEPVRPVSPTGPSVSHRQEVTGVCVTGHPGRPLVVSGGLDNAALLWDVTGPKPAQVRLPHPTGVRSVAATGRAVKSQLVATGGEDGVIRVWDVSNPDRPPTHELKDYFAEAHGAAVTALAFSPDGTWLVSGGVHELLVWDAATGKLRTRLPTRAERAHAVAFLADGRLAVAGGRPGQEGDVRLYDLAHPDATPELLLDADDSVLCLAVSPDGKRLAAGGCDRLVRVWDVTRSPAELTHTIDSHADWVLGLAFGPGGKRLASAARDKTAKVWDFAANESVASFTDHTGPVAAVVFAGGRVVSAGADNVLRAWEPGTDAKQQKAAGHTDDVTALLVVPGRELLLSGSADGSVRVWASGKLTPAHTLPGFDDCVYAVAASADGKWAAAGGHTGEVRVWAAADGKERVRFVASPR